MDGWLDGWVDGWMDTTHDSLSQLFLSNRRMEKNTCQPDSQLASLSLFILILADDRRIALAFFTHTQIHTIVALWCGFFSWGLTYGSFVELQSWLCIDRHQKVRQHFGQWAHQSVSCQFFDTRSKVGHISESQPEENRVGPIRCWESPRTQCPSMSSCYRKERGTFRALVARVEKIFSGGVISPCIKAQFKQTSVGAVTVRRRNALPVCATLPSAICGSTVTVWLMMPHSLPEYQPQHSLCPWRKTI